MTWALVYLVLLGLSPSKHDDETESERSVRLAWLAVAISEAARNESEAVALVAISYEESEVAGYVQRGQCMEEPWVRLRPNCDQGRSRSGWQLQQCTCRDLWELPEGEWPALQAAARCAIRHWRFSLWRCDGSSAGAFGAYAGQGCDWADGERRAKVLANIARRFRRARARGAR